MAIADSYKRSMQKNLWGSDSTWNSISQCGNWLEFKRHITTGDRKLSRANFCKYKLCPMCAWRRSLKIFGQVSRVLEETDKAGYAYLHVVLTQRNVEKSELKAEIGRISKALTKMYQNGWFKKAVKGFFRAFEVTHNVDPASDSYDTYHPHVHMIWIVDRSYFKSRNYISQDMLCKKWQKLMQLDYNPTCWIERASTRKKGHVREVAKYSVKPGDIINDDVTLMDSALMTLDTALFRKRMIAWGGKMAEIHAALAMDDAEDGDLINTDGDTDETDPDHIIEKFSWHIGYRQYVPQGVK